MSLMIWTGIFRWAMWLMGLLFKYFFLLASLHNYSFLGASESLYAVHHDAVSQSNILMMISYKWQHQFGINMVCLSPTTWEIGPLIVISAYFWRTTRNSLLELLMLIANGILMNSLCNAQMGYLYIFWHF